MLPLTQNIHNQTMEYIIYSDESISRGEYFSDFFGGVLVRSRDIYEVTTAIEAKKQELNLLGEIKWVKVSVNYLEKYKEMMDLFFSFIKQDKLKLRIMFRDTNQVPSNLDHDHIANRYKLLYYQFIKHSFGLIHHCDNPKEDTYLKLYFDKLPISTEENDAFKAHIGFMQNLRAFKKARIKIRPDDIAEIDSKKHNLQQCMDIVLGAMAFRLNNKHLEIPEGATQPGNKTRAKESLFNHILELIKDANNDPDFDIALTTKASGPKDFWITPYRHWLFLPAEFRDNK